MLFPLVITDFKYLVSLCKGQGQRQGHWVEKSSKWFDLHQTWWVDAGMGHGVKGQGHFWTGLWSRNTKPSTPTPTPTPLFLAPPTPTPTPLIRPGASRVRVTENQKDFLICQITVCISGVTEMEVCRVSSGGCGQGGHFQSSPMGNVQD